MTDVEAVVAELAKFAPDVCERGDPANPALVAAFERATALALPADYRAVVAHVNGFSVTGNEVYGLRGPDESASLESGSHNSRNEKQR